MKRSAPGVVSAKRPAPTTPSSFIARIRFPTGWRTTSASPRTRARQRSGCHLHWLAPTSKLLVIDRLRLFILEVLQLFLFFQDFSLLGLGLDHLGHRGDAGTAPLHARLVDRAVTLVGAALGTYRVRPLHVVELGAALETYVLSAEVLSGHTCTLSVIRKRASIVCLGSWSQPRWL